MYIVLTNCAWVLRNVAHTLLIYAPRQPVGDESKYTSISKLSGINMIHTKFFIEISKNSLFLSSTSSSDMKWVSPEWINIYSCYINMTCSGSKKCWDSRSCKKCSWTSIIGTTAFALSTGIQIRISTRPGRGIMSLFIGNPFASKIRFRY